MTVDTGNRYGTTDGAVVEAPDESKVVGWGAERHQTTGGPSWAEGAGVRCALGAAAFAGCLLAAYGARVYNSSWTRVLTASMVRLRLPNAGKHDVAGDVAGDVGTSREACVVMRPNECRSKPRDPTRRVA